MWAKSAVVDPASGVPRHVSRRHKRWHGYRKKPRSLSPPTRGNLEPGVFLASCRWILPWNLVEYPGHRRGILAILARPIGWTAIEHWKAGRRLPAVWACRALQSYIRTRCEIGLRLADELENLAQESERLSELHRLHRAEVLARQPLHHVYAPDD